MKKLQLILFLTCVAFFAHGQSGDYKIERRDLRNYVRILTSEAFEGRETGSEGHAKAASFIADKFKELGLEKFDNDGYFQKFPLTEFYWGEVYIKTHNRKLENFSNMVFQGHYPLNEEMEVEVVFAGTGTDDELNQVEIKGRLVLVFVDNLRSFFDVRNRLGKGEAAGIIVANPGNDKQFENIRLTLKAHLLRKRYYSEDIPRFADMAMYLDTIRLLNSILIPNSELKNITGFSQRQLERKINENRISDVPINRVKVKYERIINEIEAKNVIGIIQGASNKKVIVMAHYDHLGKQGNLLFPGADDNASGVAALLVLAEYFMHFDNLKYTMKFIATDAEEAGFLGAKYYLNHPDFDADNILCSFNLDMISRIDNNNSNGRYIYCIGMGQSKELDRIILKADSLYSKCRIDVSLNSSSGPCMVFRSTDSYPFYQKGIPSILFYSGMHPDYHRPSDTYHKINFRVFRNRVRQIALVLELLQREGWEN